MDKTQITSTEVVGEIGWIPDKRMGRERKMSEPIYIKAWLREFPEKVFELSGGDLTQSIIKHDIVVPDKIAKRIDIRVWKFVWDLLDEIIEELREGGIMKWMHFVVTEKIKEVTCEDIERMWTAGELSLAAYLVQMSLAMIARGDSAVAITDWVENFLSSYYAEA